MIQKILIFFILCSITGVSTKAQDYELDTTFNADYNFYNSSSYYRPTVSNLIESPDNKLYVSGRCYDTPYDYDFTLLRFGSDGSFDYSFQPNDGFSIRLHDFKFQGDTLCSVGIKTSMWPDYHQYDESGNIINNSWSQNFHNSFYGLDSQNGYLDEDGKIVFVGSFALYSFPYIRYDIVRINTNGFPDTSLMADVYSGGSDVIWEIEPYEDDKLLVFGRWGSWFGDNSVEDGLRRIHFPSCTIDTSFNNIIENVFDSGFFSWLNDIYVLNDGKIIIVGKFKLKGIEKAQGIARLNSDGSLDASFNNANNLSDTFTLIHGINTISLLHDSTGYLIGGFFESYQGYERHCIVKTDLNGFIDPFSLNGLGVDTISYLTGTYSWGVTQILPTEDGKYYVGGQIDGFNGVTTQPVFRIQPIPYNIGITEYNDKLIRVYPNPFDDFITIQIPDELLGSEITIQSMEGRVIKEIIATSIQNQIELESCAPGTYIVNLSYDNEERYTTRIIKHL